MGRTVVSSLHQPSSRMFKAMDKVMRLGNGRRLYFGAAADAMRTMSTFGYAPDFQVNPADFLLDLACEDDAIEVSAAAEAARNAKLASVREEKLTISTVSRNESAVSASDVSGGTNSSTRVRIYPVPYLEQLYWLCRRSFHSRRAQSLGNLYLMTCSVTTFIMHT